MGSFAEAAIPRVDGLKASFQDVRDAWFIKFEGMVGHLPTEQQRGMKFLFRFIEYSPFVFSLRFRRFTRMSLGERENYLRGWEESGWVGKRLYLLMLKAVVGMCYCSVDRVAEELGFSRTCQAESPGKPSDEVGIANPGGGVEVPG